MSVESTAAIDLLLARVDSHTGLSVDFTEAWTGGSSDATHTYTGFGATARKATSVNNASVAIKLAMAAQAWDFATEPMLELLFYIDDATKFSSLTIYCATDAALTGPKFSHGTTSLYSGVPSFVPKTGWNLLRLEKALWTAATGATDATWAAITNLELRLRGIAGQTVNVWFAALRSVKPWTIVLLDHDHGITDSGLETALDIEEKYGLRSNQFVLSSLIGVAGFFSLHDLIVRYQRGHDVCSHGVTHSQMSTLTAAQKVAQAADSKAALVAAGFSRSARFYATPGGEKSAAIKAAVAPYYTLLRYAGGPTSGGVYPAHDEYLWGHPHVGLAAASYPSVATAKGWLTAGAKGTLFCILTHDITDDAGSTTGVSAAYYDELCAYIAEQQEAGVVHVMTYSELYDGVSYIPHWDEHASTDATWTERGSTAATWTERT